MGMRASIAGTIVVLSALIVGGAAGQEADYQQPEFIQLFVWHEGSGRELEPVQDLIRQYNATHDPYRIVLNHHSPSVAYQRLQAWSDPERATAPDMVLVPNAWLPQFKGLLRSLEVALSARQRAVFYPGVLDLFASAGRLQAVPWRIGGRGLVVRTDLLEQAGLVLPQTWEDVLAAAEKFHNDPDVYGIGLPGRQGGGEMLTEMTWAFGGSLYAEEDYTLATDAGTKALQLYKQLAELAQPEVLTWSQAELEALFAEGHLAMLVTDTWCLQRIAQHPGFDLQVQMLALPAAEEPVVHLIGEGLGIVNGSSHEEQCLEFVRMVCQSENQTKLLKLGGLPSGPNCGEVSQADPIWGALATNISQSRSLPAQSRQRIFDALQWALYLSLSGRQDAAGALESAEAAMASLR